MTFLGIAEAVVAPLVRAVAVDPAEGAEHDRIALGERFARAAWTGIAEPGDRLAGALIAALGAEESLAVLIDSKDADPLAARLAEVGVEVEFDELTAGVARWTPRIATPDALRSLRQAARFGAQLVIPGDEAWPVALDDLGEFAPYALWVRGRIEALAASDRKSVV